ncbi:unnamed protein product [Dibothriocephalus latus]|uniref:E3 ubiquitin-protein ligase listerin n=1 Tax=Dibothriocephalus latus TaxID=60516 RepID=A0A3P7QI06_DIBLA|nr:unnamed protein product [Dibothriocephalus latus]
MSFFLRPQVVTVYHFSSDQSLEMVIKLPENFPLAPVTVEAGQKIVAPTSNWRSWVLHLSVFINNQVSGRPSSYPPPLPLVVCLPPLPSSQTS